MKLKTILINARALIADPADWTQHAMARDKDGVDVVDTGDPTALCWCAAGAVCKAAEGARTGSRYAWQDAWLRLDYVSYVIFNLPVVTVNDKLGHAAVLKVYDLAIANCEG